ncbi:MAG: glycerol-3-phosphate 1-O-acyltransferase PlsY [Bacillota bacterium]|nr:glycerol-3-phosphate 1-O-acyltransferase PlsY [Bacillota bacterium]
MIFFILIAAYLLGSIPFGYLLAQIIGKTDIRAHGSGNIGATNVLRVMGWKAALPVFLLDFAKGFFAVLLARAVSDQPAVYLSAGLLAMIGHSFPVFLRFKGGKAVATGVGAVVALSGWVAIILLALFVIIVALTRYVSLGSIIGALSTPLLFWLLGFDPLYILFGVIMAALIVGRHHENIGRLLKGHESKISRKK